MNSVPFQLNRRLRRRGGGRIETLATLPVFFGLQDRRVVVAGGSEGATWKAELLAAAGARVEVFSERPCEGLDAMSQADLPSGCIKIQNRKWKVSDLCGAALAIGDFACATAAMMFSHACRTHGVPVNTIDRPDFCDFQFGSIVNRGPVVVGISTSGAAPILGQSIRRRIEAQLPGFLADWARIAGEVRAEVNRNLVPGRPRRAFWERFVDRAFAGPTDAGSIDAVMRDCQDTACDRSLDFGQLYLMAAPEEDIELLTLRAVRILQRADLLIHCSRVPDGLLELARREAHRLPLAVDTSDMQVRIRAGNTVVIAVVSETRLAQVGSKLDRGGIAYTTVN